MRELAALFTVHEKRGCGTEESVQRLVMWLEEVKYDTINDALVFPDGTTISIEEANR